LVATTIGEPVSGRLWVANGSNRLAGSITTAMGGDLNVAGVLTLLNFDAVQKVCAT
jgi:hypothetical protein